MMGAMAGASGGGSEDARGIREVLRRGWTGALVERPSAGALLLGHEPAVRVFRRVSGWWGSAIGVMAVVVSLEGLVDAARGRRRQLRS
jgi:hypothetical protein